MPTEDNPAPVIGGTWCGQVVVELHEAIGSKLDVEARILPMNGMGLYVELPDGRKTLIGFVSGVYVHQTTDADPPPLTIRFSDR